MPPKKNSHLLIAAWPGMGQVAVTAAYYLVSKLNMHEEDPPRSTDLFDVHSIHIQEGIARPERLPASHLFVRHDVPQGEPELGVLIGEAQEPLRLLDYCDRILDRIQTLGAEKVFTFAALVKEMRPEDRSQVFGVATGTDGLRELRQADIEILLDGQISGLNGVFLGEAARRGIPGACLLGELPVFATQISWPKASQAVLEPFLRLAGIKVDLGELREYGLAMERQVSNLFRAVAKAKHATEEGEEKQPPESPDAPGDREVTPRQKPPLSELDQRRIEDLFREASRNRSKAFELKRELDRLEVFKSYENRFLDLFRKHP